MREDIAYQGLRIGDRVTVTEDRESYHSRELHRLGQDRVFLVAGEIAVVGAVKVPAVFHQDGKPDYFYCLDWGTADKYGSYPNRTSAYRGQIRKLTGNVLVERQRADQADPTYEESSEECHLCGRANYYLTNPDGHEQRRLAHCPFCGHCYPYWP